MTKAIIFHGTQGSPEGNWFRWLEKELTKTGVEVWLPKLPNADRPSLKEWTDFVFENCPFDIDEETILIGHSSGGILVLTILQRTTNKVKAAFCISAFKDNDFLSWEANNRLFDVPFNFAKIKDHTDSITFIQSDNDPYVPVEHSKYLASKTKGKLIVIPGQGHFNLETSPKYKEFPELLEIIKEKVK
jgi:hypothetical protein